jgi:predicted TIM-barrel fold metal-dependent hydrolase
LANAREELVIVLCHFGNPWFEDAAELIYKHPNVHADISGLTTGGSRYAERHLNWLARKISGAVYFAGGAEKVIFGTDYPVTTYSDALTLVRKLEVDRRDSDMILWRNAKRVFRL